MQNDTSGLDPQLLHQLVGNLRDPSKSEPLHWLPGALQSAMAQFRDNAANISACGRGFSERCSVDNVPKVEAALSVLGYAVYNVWRPHVNSWPRPAGSKESQIVGKPFGQYTEIDYALRALSLAFKSYEVDAAGNQPTAAKGGNVDHKPPEFLTKIWATRPVDTAVIERLQADCLTAARAA